MLPIREYLLFGLLPKDPQKSRKLRVKAPQYKIIDGDIYRKSYLSRWLRCIGTVQAKSIIQGITPRGSCGHACRVMIRVLMLLKIMKLGSNWHRCTSSESSNPELCSMSRFIQLCRGKSKADDDIHNFSMVPFLVRNCIVGSLTKSDSKECAKFLVVSYRYFTVWVEAKPFYHNRIKHIEERLWEPCMERRLGKNHQGWVDELPQIQRISLTWFLAQSVRSSNTNILDSPCLLVPNTGTSQSKQHDMSESDNYYLSNRVVNSFTRPNRYLVDTSLVHIESRKSPTAELFDVDSVRISIRHCDTKECH
ncbi:hypothetical protein Tco_0415642 [Tanacetum coccineum]